MRLASTYFERFEECVAPAQNQEAAEARNFEEKASQKRPHYAQQFSEIETIDHAERKRGKPCQTEAEKEGIQPIA
jgi:hypothetical protein